MNRLYYTEHLLPVYINTIHTLEAVFSYPFYLQEDGDLLHGLKRYGPA